MLNDKETNFSSLLMPLQIYIKSFSFNKFDLTKKKNIL